MAEIRRADPNARRRALRLLILLGLIGALAILAVEQVQPQVLAWILSDPAQRAERLELAFLLMGLALCGPLIAIAFWLWSLGTQSLRAQAFPPPGLPLIRDAQVHRGKAASRRARALQGLALLLAGGTLAAGILIRQLASLFGASP